MGEVTIVAFAVMAIVGLALVGIGVRFRARTLAATGGALLVTLAGLWVIGLPGAALGVAAFAFWRKGRAPASGESSLAHHEATGSGGPQAMAESNNEFMLDLYGRLRQKPGNLFFSPLSIRIALVMAQAGARGETAAQMKKALRLSLSDETEHAASAEAMERLNSAGAGKYELAVANSLWGQAGAPLVPDFLDLMTRHYGCGMNLVDFQRHTEAARAAINQWVEEKTRQRIRELIPSGGVNADTRLVLANAVYFMGMWVQQFAKEFTRREAFHKEDGATVDVPLMRQQHQVRYRQARGYQAVELDYRGGDLSMLVLLPEKKDGLADLEKGLSTRMLDDCVAGLAFREVKLLLPRFTLTWGSADIAGPLAALGMPLAFDKVEADFSGVNAHKPPDDEGLFISAVFHKAFVDVNEEGTEAAAATAAVMTLRASLAPSVPVPVPVFRADHPFLFAIRDRKGGSMLFLGRVVDPSVELG